MDATTVLSAARAALHEQARRTADLVRSLPDTDTAIPGSDWTIREAAVHLVLGATAYAELAAGNPSPLRRIDKQAAAATNAAVFADIPETDPGKLARMMTDAVARLLDVTTGRPGDQITPYHCGSTLELAQLVCAFLGEPIIHGYDMAIAAGHPWPISPDHARLVHYGYGPLFGLLVNPAATSGLTTSYRIELRGGQTCTVRFTDGVYTLEPAGSAAVDCTISADPVALLLVRTGRLPQHAAIALALLTVGGNCPDRALGFNDLFIYP